MPHNATMGRDEILTTNPLKTSHFTNAKTRLKN
ncbi:cag pathogenicity island protein [Helicobacter pylori]|uniref:Cag pathogenicity island protein n=1 Tax=Helicobacter pylori TaxID=210 RepID=A0A2T6VAG3_HELPX|nr:cag pathogenicity island protein [Helicobacter pylori]